MLVKILKSREPGAWYKKLIGVVINVKDQADNNGNYDVPGTCLYIEKGECQPLKDSEVAAIDSATVKAEIAARLQKLNESSGYGYLESLQTFLQHMRRLSAI